MASKRIGGLLAATFLAVALAVPTFAATPGSRVTTIQLTTNLGTDETFVASGPGFCPSGTADSQDVHFIEFDDAFSIRMTKRLVCDDGSGTLDIYLSAGEPVGFPRSGGWAVTGGTGDYASAVGGGTLAAHERNVTDTLGIDTMTGTITR